VRSTQDIQRDLDRLSARRSRVWAELAADGHDEAKSAEVEGLSRGIDALWAELRATKAFIRSGPPERIIARARAEDRFDREERRVRRIAA
jgi:hypothetical protein